MCNCKNKNIIQELLAQSKRRMEIRKTIYAIKKDIAEKKK